eukprot:664260-Rhodomonas_salina.1
MWRRDKGLREGDGKRALSAGGAGRDVWQMGQMGGGWRKNTYVSEMSMQKYDWFGAVRENDIDGEVCFPPTWRQNFRAGL